MAGHMKRKVLRWHVKLSNDGEYLIGRGIYRSLQLSSGSEKIGPGTTGVAGKPTKHANPISTVNCKVQGQIHSTAMKQFGSDAFSDVTSPVCVRDRP